MSFPSAARRWVVFHAIAAASAAQAQAPAVAPPPAAPAAPGYRSAFEGYVPFADDPPASWRDANETVRRRGGWKAYAREATGPVPTPSSADPHAHGHGHGRAHPAAASDPAPSRDRP